MRHTTRGQTLVVLRGRSTILSRTSSFAFWALAALILIGLASYASLSLFSAPTTSAVTTVPTKLNFQGRLTDSAGTVKPSGTYNMRFKLYTVATAGSAVWSEDRLVSASQGVTVTNGQFSVQLGSVTALPASLFASGALYLEVELPTPATATTSSPSWTEGAMTPRNQMATSAYAYNSETLDGQDGDYYLNAGNLTGTVSSARLSGSYTGITGTGALAAGSIASGFGTIATNNTISGTVLSSTVATGTAPLTVTSTTLVTNLNADLLDGQTGSYYNDATNLTGTVNTARVSGSYTGITGVGTVTAGTWQGTDVGVQYGGTGVSSFTANGIVYGNGTGTLLVTAAGTTGQCLVSTTSAAPTWGACGSGGAMLAGNNTFTGYNTFQNSSNSATAFQIKTASAASLFTADTQNMKISVGGDLEVAGNIEPSVSSQYFSSFGVMADSVGTDSVGDLSTIAIGTDGYPSVLHRNNTAGTIRYVKCTAQNCSTLTATNVIVTSASITSSHALYMNNSNMARIVYTESNSVYLKSCTNSSCSTSTTQTVVTDAASGAAVIKGADGFARILYRNATLNQLKYIICTNDACSTSSISTTPATLETSLMKLAVALDSSGNLRMLYKTHDGTNYRDKYMACTNAACTTAGTIKTILTSNLNWGSSISVNMNSDGYAGYLYTSNTTLYYAKCNDVDCTTVTPVTISTNANSTMVSLVNDKQGMPSIAYGSSTNGQPAVISRCKDLSCNIRYNVSLATAGQNGATHAYDSNGIPYASFENNNTSRDLMISSPSATVGGSNIGSESKYIGDMYLSRLYAKESVFNGFDIAENYTTTDMSIAAGDVVATSGGTHIEKASTVNNQNAIGVVSTKPGITLAEWEGQSSDRPVALAGRVPVKVTTENGTIQPGDYLTTSSTPGHAMKATEAGPTIGRAMESFGDETGKVLMFIDNSYYNPYDGQNIQGSDGTFTNLVVSGQLKVQELVVEGGAIFKGDITVQGHIVSAGEVPGLEYLDETCLEASVEGTDSAGTISITTKANCQPVNELLKLVFSKTYAKKPRVVLSPSNTAAAKSEYYKGSVSPEGFTLSVAEALTAGTEYVYDYIVIE